MMAVLNCEEKGSKKTKNAILRSYTEGNDPFNPETQRKHQFSFFENSWGENQGN
jgi:hypothetical protein